ncbi:MAG TPA: SDR family NAD(P)-dependent oxidoreductase [Thermoleophilaceae bacterium]|jgi:NADP-dependent 3-hydroxy acid dehydrogenase YdfG|nr:SDR family NAD(P)-dependent oxidoreductase [Thermoleophilaceae bacterium]
MSDRVAVVTGASSGIGEATARALAGAGYAVVLAARREDRINELCEEISGGGGKALAVPTDVTDESSARALIKAAKDELGSVDVLVNNAGVMLLGPIFGADTEHWRRMVNVNLLGLMYCTHAVLPVMQEQGAGHIVNLSSVAGRVATLGSGVYNATKWGVGAFSEALRQEVLDFGVRVTIVEPGYVETELQGHNELPIVVETMEKNKEEIGEVLQAEDIANAILYAVQQPHYVSINEVLVRPTKQRR